MTDVIEASEHENSMQILSDKICELLEGAYGNDAVDALGFSMCRVITATTPEENWIPAVDIIADSARAYLNDMKSDGASAD